MKKQQTTKESSVKVKPKRKKRLSLPGMVVRLATSSNLGVDPSFEKSYEMKLPSFLKKGWCVSYRKGYVGLGGYTTESKTHTPYENRKKDTDYKTFTNKKGKRKTRIYLPGEDILVSIALINSGGQSKWEVKTYWTIQRHIFVSFDQAWHFFLEIEQRYDPGEILWSKLEEYDEFEPY